MSHSSICLMSLQPEYAKAAQQLKDVENVKVVKVDATVCRSDARMFVTYSSRSTRTALPSTALRVTLISSGSARAPSCHIMVRGIALLTLCSRVTGGRTTSEIVAYIRKKAGAPSTPLHQADDLAAMISVRSARIWRGLCSCITEQ
jgi:hypothetical protein